MKKEIVAVGGTFDRLHDGHKALILEAFRLGDRVIIGLTSDLFVKSAGKVGVEPYDERRLRLLHYLTSSDLADRMTLVKIDDRFGPTTTDEAILHIVVTKETYGSAVDANRLRVARGMRPMKIRVVDMILAKDKLPISSSRIRRGELDEHGNQTI